MKRIALILLLTMASILLFGCSKQYTIEEPYEGMFVVVSNEYCGLVVVDRTTGVMYWESDGSYSTGNLTLLVNPDGTPRVWSEEKEGN